MIIRTDQQFAMKQMENLKTVEEKLFQKVLQLQRSNMESRLAFTLLLINQYLFKDVLLLLIFLIPIPILQSIPPHLFSTLVALNLPLTLIIMIFLSLFLSVYIFSTRLHPKLLGLAQIITPWLNAISLCLTIANIHLAAINFTQNIILAICNLISLLLLTAMQLAYNMFYFTKSPRTHNLYDIRQAPCVMASSMLLLCLCAYLSVEASNAGVPFGGRELIACSTIHLLLSVIKFKERIYRKYYVDVLSQNISSVFYLLELNLSILVTLGNVFSSQDFIFRNILPILLSMTFLGYSALTAYAQHRTSDMFLSNAGEIKDEEQAMLYLDCMCSLVTKVQNQQEDIILISLTKKHAMQCSDLHCYCRTSTQFKPFVYEYVKCELAELSKLFHHSPSILISVLYFKLVLFQFYPDVLAHLTALSANLRLSLIARYHQYCLTQEVKQFINKRNCEINSIESQHMFRLQQIRLEIQDIIKAEIEVRSKKWKYVSRGLCRISELQHNCNRELKHINRVMTLFHENIVTFKKSKQFNLLLLFYFTKVSFIDFGKDVRNNLKEIYYGYRQDELFDLKEFRKFIYHKRSCVFETLVDDKSMGIITAASQNCQEMFGFPSTQVVGLSINDLMPKFMAVEHEHILSEWAKSGTWRTIGTLKEIYCVHKEQYCFSALLYLRLYIKENKMYFITNIFKLNETDYMVLNPSMKIQGLGKKFVKVLGESAKYLNIDILIENIENNNRKFSMDNLAEGKTYNQIFMSVRNMEREVDCFLEVKTAKSLQDLQSKQQKFHKQLKENSEEKYYIEFNIKRYHMGRISFIVVNMLDASKIQKHETANYLNSPPTLFKVEFSRSHIEDIEEEKRSQDEHDDTEQLLMDHNANSSMTSTTDKQNYPLAKTINKFTDLLQSPSNIHDKRLTKFNCLIIFMLVFLSVIDFISFLTYRTTLYEIQDVFFANAAVSDIMQTTEIAYSQLYVLQSQLRMGMPTDFKSTLTSLTLIQNYVYSLKQHSFTHLPSEVTSLTQQRIYSYIYHPTQWLINNRNVSIETYQFLQQFYYLTSKVISQLKIAEKSNTTFSNSTLLILYDNFPQLQTLNEYFLSSYQQQSDSSHNILNYLSITSLVVYLLATISLAYIINHYFVFRFKQVVNSFNFFSHIPSLYIQKMKEYYSMLMKKIINSDRLKHIDSREDEIFSIDTYDLFHKDNNAKGSHNSKIKFINSENYYKWIYILLVLCFVNGINYIASLQIRNFYLPSQQVIGLVTDLMRAQNKVMESYFNLKSAYYLEPTQFLNQDLYDALDNSLYRSDKQWIQVLEDLTTTLTSYDPNYQENLANALVTSICNITASKLTPFQNDKCKNNISLNILEGGIMFAMNFFQRSVRNALEDLEMQYVKKTKPTYPTDYFQQVDFVELDKMLFYMFKIFQRTQIETFSSYITAIELITNNYLKITLAITIFFVLVLLVWIKTISIQKQQLSLLYGHLLLVPFMILKANNRIATNLKQVIEYSDY